MAFVFVNDYLSIEKTLFVENNSFINLKNSIICSNKTTEFIKEVINKYNVKTIDFLSCSLLNNLKWKSFFDFISIDNDITVRASDDKTGNLKYGGNWILESTNDDIK